jgi:ABC-type sugar transport system ATPase subunit
MSLNAAEATLAAPGIACRVLGVSKNYGGVKALRSVDVDFHAGRVHAILGENGAGKSTLMKILAGAETPGDGVVEVGGLPVRHASVQEANRSGVAIVFQELSLFPDLDVLANLFTGREPSRFGVVNRSEMARRARPVLDSLGLDVNLSAQLGSLPLHERQLVEIAKALLVDAKIIIFDEPTSSLSADEAGRLLQVIRRLRAQGVAIIFVSHRLEEVSEIADDVTVLRDGELVRTVSMAATDMAALVIDMIGSDPAKLPDVPRVQVGVTDRPLRLEGISTATGLKDVSLEVHQGEVVGLAGLEDAGVRDVMDVVFGVARSRAGTVTLPDGSAGPSSPVAAARRGLALVPSDRRQDGLMLHDNIWSNVVSVGAGVTRRHGLLLRRGSLRRQAEESIAPLHVKYGNLDDAAGSLSGGNQQKVVLGKWLHVGPTVFLLDDPTRGVDLGAKLEIYTVIRDLAARGCWVLFASSELEEYRHLCHRVVVMRRGAVRAEIAGDAATPTALLHAMNT